MSDEATDAQADADLQNLKDSLRIDIRELAGGENALPANQCGIPTRRDRQLRLPLPRTHRHAGAIEGRHSRRSA
jgi:hypothetical protein